MHWCQTSDILYFHTGCNELAIDNSVVVVFRSFNDTHQVCNQFLPVTPYIIVVAPSMSKKKHLPSQHILFIFEGKRRYFGCALCQSGLFVMFFFCTLGRFYMHMLIKRSAILIINARVLVHLLHNVVDLPCSYKFKGSSLLVYRFVSLDKMCRNLSSINRSININYVINTRYNINQALYSWYDIKNSTVSAWHALLSPLFIKDRNFRSKQKFLGFCHL